MLNLTTAPLTFRSTQNMWQKMTAPNTVTVPIQTQPKPTTQQAPAAAQAPPANNVYQAAPNYSAINANALSQLSQSEGLINNALNRLGSQLDIAKYNIGQTYGQRSNELDTGYKNSQNTYNTSTTQNQQGFRTNKNAINDQASAGLRGLLRMLGSRGAVGSDLSLASRTVMDEATAQNAGAGQTYAQNQSSLDSNWGNYKNTFDTERKKLNDWQTQQLNNAEQQSLTSRQDLLSKLANIRGEMAAARGGSYARGAQSYLDQANALSGQIDQLGRFTPTYTGTTPVFTPAPLSSYDTSNRAAASLQNNPAVVADTPYLNMLLEKDKQKSLVG